MAGRSHPASLIEPFIHHSKIVIEVDQYYVNTFGLLARPQESWSWPRNARFIVSLLA